MLWIGRVEVRQIEFVASYRARNEREYVRRSLWEEFEVDVLKSRRTRSQDPEGGRSVAAQGRVVLNNREALKLERHRPGGSPRQWTRKLERDHICDSGRRDRSAAHALFGPEATARCCRRTQNEGRTGAKVRLACQLEVGEEIGQDGGLAEEEDRDGLYADDLAEE